MADLPRAAGDYLADDCGIQAGGAEGSLASCAVAHARQQAAGGLRVGQEGEVGIGGRVQGCDVGGREGGGDALRREFAGAGQGGKGCEIERGGEARGAQHFAEMPAKAEAGDIGAGDYAVRAQNGGSDGIGADHRSYGRLYPNCARLASHCAGEHDADAERLGQHQCVAGP